MPSSIYTIKNKNKYLLLMGPDRNEGRCLCLGGSVFSDQKIMFLPLQFLNILKSFPQSQSSQICRGGLRHQHFLIFSRLSQDTAKLEKQWRMPSASKGEAEVIEKTQALPWPP